MDIFGVAIYEVWANSGYAGLTVGNLIMILVGLILLYLAFGKKFEPLLLGPIAFGCILANFPKSLHTKERNTLQKLMLNH